MIIKHIKTCELETNPWSGGTTTQLYIYPEKSSYQKLNFEFRVSTSKIELESSKFTLLPGISRELMILDGGIFISHTNHHKKQLNKFDTDTFKGEWDTISDGRCIDFNLMCNKNNSGEITAHKIIKDKSILVKLNSDSKFYCIYVFKGEVSFRTKNILTGELLILSEFEDKNIELIATQFSEVIITEIF